MNKYILIPVALLAALSSKAQFKMSGELRPRAEYCNGYKTLPDTATAAFFVSQRSRIIMNYASEKYSIGFSLQHVGVWGDDNRTSSSGMFGNDNSVDVNEAWVEMKINELIKLKAGRQLWKYDDEHLIAGRNWNQYGYFYDGALFKVAQSKNELHVGLSLNNDSENTYGNALADKNKLKTLNFMWFKHEISQNISLSSIHIAAGYHKPTTEVIYITATSGASVIYTTKTLDSYISGYYQYGENMSSKKINAYMLNGKLKYLLGKPFVGCGVDYISGQNATKQNQNYQSRDHVFDILYGARFKYYGFMGYFSNMEKDTKNSGLVDPFINIGYSPNEKHSVTIDYHYFFSAQKVIDSKATAADTLGKVHYFEKNLAQEFDFTYNFKLNKEIAFQAGYCVLLPQSTLKAFQGIDNKRIPNYGWVMLTVKPEFIK